MPRRRSAENREVNADPVYSSTLAEKFICSMMWEGKKSTAQRIFYDSMKKLEERFLSEHGPEYKIQGPLRHTFTTLTHAYGCHWTGCEHGGS